MEHCAMVSVERELLIYAIWSAIESMTGAQLVFMVTLEEDGTITPRTWAIADDLAQNAVTELAEGRWNRPKSL
jgi:hypothetical protein